MIGRLRRKFVLCALAALVVTFGLVCAAINVGSHVLITRRADETIALLREGGGSFPETEVDADPLIDGMFRVTEETPFATRYFVASFDGRGKVDRVDDEHIASFDRLEIADVA